LGSLSGVSLCLFIFCLLSSLFLHGSDGQLPVVATLLAFKIIRSCLSIPRLKSWDNQTAESKLIANIQDARPAHAVRASPRAAGGPMIYISVKKLKYLACGAIKTRW
jgi:hypothetical protein